MWEVKKNFKISVLGTWNPAILRLQGARNYGRLNANLFFEEPQQFTKFTWRVHLNKVW